MLGFKTVKTNRSFRPLLYIKMTKDLFISIMIVLNHSRLKSFQKICHDHNRNIILISSEFETLFGVRNERFLQV